jgi:hypothetical protein
MKVRTAILWLALLLGFCSCTDKQGLTDTLHRAEALMNEYPDSALQLLRALPVADMQQTGNRARYALLYSQVLDKNYIDETNDSLINIAVDYYRHTDDVRNKFLAFYYRGRVYANGGDFLCATSNYMEAEQLADAVNDGYLQGLLYAEMGRIYRLCYDYSKSLEAHQKAAECYERAGKIRHRNYMWLNQSLIYKNMNQYTESEHLLQQTLLEAKEQEDNDLLRECLGDLILLAIEQGKMSKARLYNEDLEQQNLGYKHSVYFMSKVAEMYISEGKLSIAKAYIDEGWNLAIERKDSVYLYISSSLLFSAMGYSNEAYQSLQKGTSLQVKEVHQALSQPVLTAQRDYLVEKLELEAYQLRLEKRYKLLSILFLMMLLAVTVYVFIRIFKRYKKRTQQTIRFLENEKTKAEVRIASLLTQLDKDREDADLTIAKLKEEIHRNEENSHAEIARLLQHLEQSRGGMKDSLEQLRSELEALQDDNQKLSSQKLELLKNYLEQVVELVLLHSENWHNDNYKIKRVNEKVALLKLHYFAGEKEYKQVEKLVNLYLDNVMVHFRKEVSLVSESDYRRVCYMFAGVSAPYIAQIMDESKEVVYQRRSRLLKKLASLPCCHKEMFVLLLSK